MKKLLITLLLFPCLANASRWEDLSDKQDTFQCYKLKIDSGWLIKCGQGLTFIPDLEHKGK